MTSLPPTAGDFEEVTQTDPAMFQINQLIHRGRANVNGQTVEVTAVIVEDFSIIADSIPFRLTTGSGRRASVVATGFGLPAQEQNGCPAQQSLQSPGETVVFA
jgi:hypothetical protein